jgi:23S rRNA (cytosine1962-C5)-methyltransferase
MGTITLKPGREKSVLKKHPWIFSGSIAQVDGITNPGEVVAIIDAQRKFLAWGDYNPFSQIAARIWSWNESLSVNPDLVAQRITASISRREEMKLRLRGMNGNALRLIYAESDGLPGLIVDQYAETLVVQFLTAGIEHWRELVVEVLDEVTGIEQVYERSDVEIRKLEGLELRKGVLRGREPKSPVSIIENGVKFEVDICNGQKTGFYLDQKINRFILPLLSSGKDVLDCFCYTGGFTCAAGIGGATSITAIDSSADALRMTKRHLELNQFDAGRVRIQEADVFSALRQFRDRGLSFDLIILDPPKFAQSQAQVEKAARAYKDINLLAFKLLRPGGILSTFSCSGNIDELLFQKIIAGAALDAQVGAQILQRLQQSPDHPAAVNLPESVYLKGFLIQTLN